MDDRGRPESCESAAPLVANRCLERNAKPRAPGYLLVATVTAAALLAASVASLRRASHPGASVASPQRAASPTLSVGQQASQDRAAPFPPARAAASTGESGLDISSKTADTESDLARACSTLQAAIEASVFGSFDPAQVLDAALAIGSLEVDRHPRSQPDVSGCIVYPLLDGPEGLDAGLFVGHSSRPGIGQVLSLRIELEKTEHPYVLDGVARTSAAVQVQMQMDHAGSPLNLTILTDLPASPRSRALGLAVDSGTVTQGLLYHIDVRVPSAWGLTMHGLRDGAPAWWEAQGVPAAGAWMPEEKLQAFADLLKAKYAHVQH